MRFARLPGLEKALSGGLFYVCFQIGTITESTITEVTCVALFGMSVFEVPT